MVSCPRLGVSVTPPLYDLTDIRTAGLLEH
jgi:hypothetical protein